MGGEHAAKRDSNKSVFFWRKKLEPVSLPVQITIISQGKKTQKKEEEKRKRLEKKEK